MSTEENKKKNVWLKVLKIAGISIAGLLSFIYIAEAVWTMSGSNEWKLRVDKDNVKIYSLKSPGTPLLKFKGVTQYEGYTLGHFVAAMIDDNNLANCQEWIPGCIDMKEIQPWSDSTMSDAWMMTFKMFFPFKPREYLYKSYLQQDEETKEVYINLIAAPDLHPPVDGRVRLTHLHNYWRYTPQGSGVVDIEVGNNFDAGGLFPKWLQNVSGPTRLYYFLHRDLPGLLDKDRYRGVTYDYITEVE